MKVLTFCSLLHFNVSSLYFNARVKARFRQFPERCCKSSEFELRLGCQLQVIRICAMPAHCVSVSLCGCLSVP